jgi:hypothetical protein
MVGKQTRIRSGILNYPVNSMYRLLIIWLILLLVGFIATSICLPFLVPDSGYYLKIAFDIHNGAEYFSEINTAYTPLGMYLLAVVFDIFPLAGLPIFNFLNIILLFISALLFYKILTLFELNVNTKILFTLLLLLSLFATEGCNILLEPFVLVFQLLAVLFVLKQEKHKSFFGLFGVGFFCFLAFFSKQYGLSVILAILWFTFINNVSWKKKIHDFTLLGLGFFLPLFFVILYFNHQKVPILEIIYKLAGIDYLAGNDNVTGVGYNFWHFLESVGRFICENPVILILVPLLFRKNKKPVSSHIVFFTILILGGCIQLLFAGYRHYYQLIVPYCLLLIAILLQNVNALEAKKIYYYFLLLCTLFLIMASYYLVKTAIKRDRLLGPQRQNITILNQTIPPGQKVYLQGISPAYYFLCQYDSPDIKTLGYRFPDELNARFIYRNIPSGAYLIVDDEFVKTENYPDSFEEVRRIQLSEGKEYIILHRK